jgi:hypothetical protein
VYTCVLVSVYVEELPGRVCVYNCVLVSVYVEELPGRVCVYNCVLISVYVEGKAIYIAMYNALRLIGWAKWNYRQADVYLCGLCARIGMCVEV